MNSSLSTYFGNKNSRSAYKNKKLIIFCDNYKYNRLWVIEKKIYKSDWQPITVKHANKSCDHKS